MTSPSATAPAAAAPSEAKAESDNWNQSVDISVGAFATFIDDDNIPGFDSLNNSNFFDQVGNKSKLFDGDASASQADSSASSSGTTTLKTVTPMSCLKKKASAPHRRHRMKRKSNTPNSFQSPYMSNTNLYLEEGIDEEDTEFEETDDEEEATHDTVDEALGAFIKHKDEPVNDVESVATTTAASFSSTEGSTASSGSTKASAAKKTNSDDVTKRALALKGLVQQADEAVKEKTKSLLKKPSAGGSSQLGKSSDGNQEEEGDPHHEDTPGKRRSTRKKKVDQESQDGENEEAPLERKNSKGTSAVLSSKPRQRRGDGDNSSRRERRTTGLDVDRQGGDHGSRRERRTTGLDVDRQGGDHGSRRERRTTGLDVDRQGGDHSLRRERRTSGLKPSTNGELTPTGNVRTSRSQRFREQRASSFGPESTEAAAGATSNDDVLSSSPKLPPKRNKTLPLKSPHSVELRRVTRNPARSRRATLGAQMLARNLSIMDQEADTLVEEVETYTASSSKSPKTKGGDSHADEKEETWKLRRTRSVGDAAGAAKNAAQERLGRKGAIQSAAFALTGGKPKEVHNDVEVVCQRVHGSSDSTKSLAEKAKNAAREHLARKESLQSAAVALSAGMPNKVGCQQLHSDVEVISQRLRGNVGSAMDRIVLNGLDNWKANETHKTTGEATVKDDSYVHRPPPMTPNSAARRARRRPSCS